MKGIANLLNEIGMLTKTPRSGFAFLGSGSQSVAEHSYHMTMVAYALAHVVKERVDLEKLLCLCLFHDLLEARTGDLNAVNKRYVVKDDVKALTDFRKETKPFGDSIAGYIEEYEANETLEARLAHDADSVELLLMLKKEYDTGNDRAMKWFEVVEKRLETQGAKQIARDIRKTTFDAWWMARALPKPRVC